MRVGKWVPIYGQILPVPRRIAMAFGLYEKSELHVALIRDQEKPHRMGAELIVSPIPVASWRSACRLSLRLSDEPLSLAKAAAFLRERRINILLSECCNTYQHRAHWDAICDVQHATGYAELSDVTRADYETAFRRFLDELTAEYGRYMEVLDNQSAFAVGAPKYVDFSPLTGLNDASFMCQAEAKPLVYHVGAIDLPNPLVERIIRQCRMEHKLPDYAMVTGNTEQRYMRVLFLRDYDSLFEVKIDNDLSKFAAKGTGVLAQLLGALPKEVNLIRTSNYILSNHGNETRSRITLTGYWSMDDEVDRAARIKEEIQRMVDGLELEDAAGNKHKSASRVFEFSVPKTAYPRVFISYSTSYAHDKLRLLQGALWHNQFHPVLGTVAGQQGTVGTQGVPADVTQSSFQAIIGCVAFISLQVKREDFVRQEHGAARYTVPPWTVAEEVYAWSKNIGFLVRLKDAEVEEPRYNRNTHTRTFTSDDDFEQAVEQVISDLNAFRKTDRFLRVKREAQEAQYEEEKRYSPDHD